jgi:hypothetical protein
MKCFEVFLTCVAFFAIGCAREGPLSHDQRIALRQVDQLVPRGTSETRAKKALSDRGFQLVRLNAGEAANHLLIATRTKGDRTWQVGLIIVDAKVAGSTVTVLDVSVPPK